MCNDVLMALVEALECAQEHTDKSEALRALRRANGRRGLPQTVTERSQLPTIQTALRELAIVEAERHNDAGEHVMRLVTNIRLIHGMTTTKLLETVQQHELWAPGRRRTSPPSKQECIRLIIEEVLGQYPRR